MLNRISKVKAEFERRFRQMANDRKNIPVWEAQNGRKADGSIRGHVEQIGNKQVQLGRLIAQWERIGGAPSRISRVTRSLVTKTPPLPARVSNATIQRTSSGGLSLEPAPKYVRGRFGGGFGGGIRRLFR